MRGLFLVWLSSWSVGLAACSSPNPAYESSSAGEDSTQNPTEGTSGTDTAIADESSGVMACELGPSQPLAITVDLDGVVRPPDCSVPYVDFALGANLYASTGDSMVHEQCMPLSCDCAEEPPQLNIELAADRAFDENITLPDCGRVSMWARMGPSGCEWAGVVLWEADEPSVPWYIASRTLGVPPLGHAFMLELEPDEACDGLDACANSGRQPGRYAIDVLGFRTVTMDESPPLIELPFGATGETRAYLFDNRMATLSRDCELEVAWTAGLF
ncbi:hypothetical protein [Paraliomyxa miuraensis]|uniref:hypothetical protein n=1 Tax=Paraliomyxa miuraensis TaxID=376150 RepID=UPI002254319B|nr:hypothetical protein [Paraliomyxa miuraensis]MCX4239501.1 hypothetical protein [Paraliomyxa miuraensis]